jgi:hypothetical protein
MTNSSEPIEHRIVRYLDMAEQALRAAAIANRGETREGYLAIAMSWLDLAEKAYRQDS